MVERMKQELSSLAAGQALYTQEAPAKLKKSKGELFIGVPTELSFQENRAIPLAIRRSEPSSRLYSAIRRCTRDTVG